MHPFAHFIFHLTRVNYMLSPIGICVNSSEKYFGTAEKTDHCFRSGPPVISVSVQFSATDQPSKGTTAPS